MDNHNIEVQQAILESDNRQRIIGWLVWNDANGVYSDDDCEQEGWKPMTLAEAKALMREILSR